MKLDTVFRCVCVMRSPDLLTPALLLVFVTNSGMRRLARSLYRDSVCMLLQEQEVTKKQEAELARVRRDRGEGEPVPLVPGGKRERVTAGREVEVSLDHGDTEDSDDVPEEEDHRGTNGCLHHDSHIITVTTVP